MKRSRRIHQCRGLEPITIEGAFLFSYYRIVVCVSYIMRVCVYSSGKIFISSMDPLDNVATAAAAATPFKFNRDKRLEYFVGAILLQ